MTTTEIDQEKQEAIHQQRRSDVQRMYEQLASEKPEPFSWRDAIIGSLIMLGGMMLAAYILLYRVIG